MRYQVKQLIILQPTPFCNIDCRYCYLPSRSVTDRMSYEVMERIFDEVFQNKRFDDPLSFVWHAGEPLTVPLSYYREAFDLSSKLNQPYQRKYYHVIQTNGTLINDEWADFFLEYNVKVGVSIDGPSFIHDKNRITRLGQGTHERVLRGIKILQSKGIPFDVIMVLTRFALDYPDEIFNFFIENGIKNVGFNIDELEGNHKTSSFEADDATLKYRKFIRRFVQLVDDSQGKLIVREFRQLASTVLHTDDHIREPVGSINTPLQILTFDCHGNYSTFCPELSGTKSERFGNFVMGNVLVDPIEKILDNPIFLMVNEEVQAGVRQCEKSCAYWKVCGGGFPANKFFENGRFDVMETIHCRIHTQATVDVILEYFENKLQLRNVDEIAHNQYI